MSLTMLTADFVHVSKAHMLCVPLLLFFSQRQNRQGIRISPPSKQVFKFPQESFDYFIISAVCMLSQNHIIQLICKYIVDKQQINLYYRM